MSPKLIKAFKSHVTKLARDKKFIHHRWYVKYHLEIVEKIAMELCDIYRKADRNLVVLLVWLHDYGKLIDYKNPHKATIIYGRKKLKGIGFTDDIIKKSLNLIRILDKKNPQRLKRSPIEIQIVSSADGASHLTGPFHSIFLYENSRKPLDRLLEGNIEKIKNEWDNKIVLPEVKKAFKQRKDLLLEINGRFPRKYI